MLFRAASLLATLALVGSTLGSTIPTTSAVESPFSLTPPSIQPGKPVSKQLIETLGLTPGGTTPNTGLHSLISFPTYDALILCSQPSCGGTCTDYALSQISVDPYLCDYALYAYESAYIYTTHGNGLNYGVYAALNGCAQPTQLRSVNICYTVDYNGVPYPFTTFYVT